MRRKNDLDRGQMFVENVSFGGNHDSGGVEYRKIRKILLILCLYIFKFKKNKITYVSDYK